MYNVWNAGIALFDNGEVGYIFAKLKDQSYETMMKLGRGNVSKIGTNALIYHPKGGHGLLIRLIL